MNKKILIISPYFPPTNAADMQRVRMSLPYFAGLGWDAEIVTVDDKYADLSKDELLVKSVPSAIKIHKVKAFNKKWTSKLGIGSIALRSMWFFRQKVNELLKNKKFDLVYFSTTQFPVCVLGSYWKKRFGVPYVIDMQDPWYSDYYDNKAPDQKPKKYLIVYSLHKYLEAKAIKHTDGLISVSENYITVLKTRYPEIKNIAAKVITFGAFEPDLKIVGDNKDRFDPILNPETKNIVYIGRGGIDLHKAITPVFEALVKGLATEPELFTRLKLYFIGTSYAAKGDGIQSIIPLAKEYGVETNIVEIPERIGYYHTLLTLQQANALFIPGSDQPAYTASKTHPYIMANKPLLTIFNAQSPAIPVLQEYNTTYNYSYDGTPDLGLKIYSFFKHVMAGDIETPCYNIQAIEKYSAKNMALQQCNLFDEVINE